MKERRRFRRVKNGAKVIFKVLEKKGEEDIEVMDIGTGGICIPLPKKLKQHELLELGLILPHQDRPFYVFARVAWQSKFPKKSEDNDTYFETGVEFLRMDFEERKKLVNYIHNNPKENIS